MENLTATSFDEAVADLKQVAREKLEALVASQASYNYAFA